jgi:hypothetical protein
LRFDRRGSAESKLAWAGISDVFLFKLLSIEGTYFLFARSIVAGFFLVLGTLGVGTEASSVIRLTVGLTRLEELAALAAKAKLLSTALEPGTF